MHTTLNRIRECSPCTDGWKKLLNHLGKTEPDDEPLSLLTILNLNEFDHALWCLRAVHGFEKAKLLLAITYAKEVEHLMPAESKKALGVFERYANELATEKEFKKAAANACAAAWRDAARANVDAVAAWEAVWAACADAAAARAADVRAAAAAAAAWAADAAAWEAARAARAAAADAAWEADVAAAWEAAYSTVLAKQETQLRQLLEKTCTQP